ncbi:MAG: TldD/PmbA family protein [Rhodobacterales bacterium]|nr:TldD/PmbA family protein [Rhodobacterales bacterium]
MNRRHFLGGTAASLSFAACGPPNPESSIDAPSGVFSDESVRAVLAAALDAATRAGASYADVRLSHHRNQSIQTREQRVRSLSDSRSSGLGVRVLVDGTWGFSALNKLTEDDARLAAKQAVALAIQNRPLQLDPVRLAPITAGVGRWETPVGRDAFAVPLEEKIERLMAINQMALAKTGVNFVRSSMHFVREHKFFASTDGAWTEQILHRCNPTFQLTSIHDKTGSFRTRNALCAPQGRGYDFIEAYDWDTDVSQAAEDVVAMHTARSVEPGKTDLILLPSNLWLTIHESIGHPTELDRALGYEANYAGTSFLTPELAGKFQIGSELVNFEAEKTAEGALATCQWDDDGDTTGQWPLITDGVLVDFQTTRDQAHLLEQPRGRATSYAQSWRDVPFQRMPNINLKPGKKPLTLDQLVADTERGILIAGRGSYSIDQQRYNFQFGGQVYREIVNGKVGDLLTDVAYQSNTAHFWKSCDAICSDGYEVNGSFYDGKGQPGQVNAVSHGCAPARFRQIDVIRTGVSS